MDVTMSSFVGIHEYIYVIIKSKKLLCLWPLRYVLESEEPIS